MVINGWWVVCAWWCSFFNSVVIRLRGCTKMCLFYINLAGHLEQLKPQRAGLLATCEPLWCQLDLLERSTRRLLAVIVDHSCGGWRSGEMSVQYDVITYLFNTYLRFFWLSIDRPYSVSFIFIFILS